MMRSFYLVTFLVKKSSVFRHALASQKYYLFEVSAQHQTVSHGVTETIFGCIRFYSVQTFDLKGENILFLWTDSLIKLFMVHPSYFFWKEKLSFGTTPASQRFKFINS